MTKIPDDPRVTRVGRFLRRSSIDELPQLINVIKGEMSLVGPRPLILEEDAFVQEWARKRLDLKPGITGLWQVLGRSDIPFDEMTKLDYVYVTNWSLQGGHQAHPPDGSRRSSGRAARSEPVRRAPQPRPRAGAPRSGSR